MCSFSGAHLTGVNGYGLNGNKIKTYYRGKTPSHFPPVLVVLCATFCDGFLGSSSVSTPGPPFHNIFKMTFTGLGEVGTRGGNATCAEILYLVRHFPNLLLFAVHAHREEVTQIGKKFKSWE